MGEKQTAKIGQGKPGPGRPKGKPNQTTTLLKDAALQAATEAGRGSLVEFLKDQALKENNAPFMGLLGKIIPLQVNAAIASTTLTKEQRDAAVEAFLRAHS